MTITNPPPQLTIHRAEIPKALQEKAVKKVATCLSEKMIEKVGSGGSADRIHTRLAWHE
jgi:sRNA-binding carbon storage regulator CsrA